MTSPTHACAIPADFAERARTLKQRNDWAALASYAGALPESLTGPVGEAADEVAFALGQLGRHAEAVSLLERAWEAGATYRRASALAYLHYAALMDTKRPRGEAREALRRGFRRWIAEALRLHPESVKDRYRLGIFESQVETRRDKVALRAFLAAIDAYRRMDATARERRHDLRKYYMRSLYAGGRSALRLGKTKLARRLAFECIRADRDTDHVAPVHKLGLAGKVCLALGMLDDAERAFRLALDGKGPPRRDYLYGLLAEAARRAGDVAAAMRWIEANVCPERRSAALWRQLGGLRREAGDADAALAAYEASLARDRGGRHLTLSAIGDIHRERGAWKAAEQAYRKAQAFRRKRYLSDHEPALRGLAEVLAARGKSDQAREVKEMLAAIQRSARMGYRSASRTRDAAGGADVAAREGAAR